MTQLENFRAQKDEFFASYPESPLTPEQKRSFQGLSYYPENLDLRLEVTVEEFAEQDEIQMQTTAGGVRDYVRFGKFKFQVDGGEAELTIYASHHGFFLPFADSLAGEETYGAGRYLEPQHLGNGTFLVDFNLAYNPYCAYNEAWACPITPFENRVKVPIRAGEKIFD
jgi:uncharacterized protein (DUF1684 family)